MGIEERLDRLERSARVKRPTLNLTTREFARIIDAADPDEAAPILALLESGDQDAADRKANEIAEEILRGDARWFRNGAKSEEAPPA